MKKGKGIPQTIRSLFGELTFEQLNWKPNPDTWSVGQNIHHLITLNETYFQTFENLMINKHQKNWVKKIPFYPSLIGKMLLSSTNPDRRTKIKTRPVFEPSTSDIPLSIFDQFEKHQKKLLKYFGALDHLDHSKTIISSPAGNFFVYSLKDTWTLIVIHEERHINQAKEIMEMEAFPK